MMIKEKQSETNMMIKSSSLWKRAQICVKPRNNYQSINQRHVRFLVQVSHSVRRGTDTKTRLLTFCYEAVFVSSSAACSLQGAPCSLMLTESRCFCQTQTGGLSGSWSPSCFHDSANTGGPEERSAPPESFLCTKEV